MTRRLSSWMSSGPAVDYAWFAFALANLAAMAVLMASDAPVGLETVPFHFIYVSFTILYGFRAWRAVHWAAYAAWPFALVHGLGTGSDTRVRWAAAINVLCLAVVLAAIGLGGLAASGWLRWRPRAVAYLPAVAFAAVVVSVESYAAFRFVAS